MPSCALTGRPRANALGQKAHTADRWIAATAIRLGIPLVSNDGIFRDAPGVELETLPSA
jgi:predicted nucleic acid-binding protein